MPHFKKLGYNTLEDVIKLTNVKIINKLMNDKLPQHVEYLFQHGARETIGTKNKNIVIIKRKLKFLNDTFWSNLCFPVFPK